MTMTVDKKTALERSTEYFNGDELAASVFVGKYALANEEGYIESTPDDMHKNRLAPEFARIESKYTNPMDFEEIYGLIKDFGDVVPQGSPMSAIGNDIKIQSASNCFVIASTLDSMGGIHRNDEEQAQLMKRRGGVGHDISNIRPAGLPTSNAAGTTDGIGVFMDRFSNTTNEVAQNGRRGALMLTCSVHHPEILTFINIKKDKTKVTGANISVKLTDEFMNAVKNNEDYEQRWPVDSKNPSIIKTVNAKKIWDEIIQAAWESAEPGLLFWDNAEKYTPSDIYSKYGFGSVSTNPCFAIDQRLLTDNGYVMFKDLIGTKETDILIDNRISFTGNDTDESWEINCDNKGTSVSKGLNFRETSPNEELFLLKFSNGSSLKVTKDHHIATSIGMIQAKDLNEGHEILVPRVEAKTSIENLEPTTVDEICALLMGLIAGDGTYSKQSVCLDFWGDDSSRIVDMCKKYIDILYSTEYDSINDLISPNWKNRVMSNYYMSYDLPRNKTRIQSTFLAMLLKLRYGFSKETKTVVPEFIMNNARSKIAQFYCAGLYYADGSVQGSVDGGYTVRLAQSNEKMLSDVQLILHANGISSGVHLRRPAHVKEIKGQMCNIKAQFELITTKSSHVNFGVIGFLGHPTKTLKLKNIIENRKSNRGVGEDFTSLVSYEYVENAPVYCLSEYTSRSCIVNAISARRCGEIILSPYDSCRLITMNLYNFVENRFTNKARFNFYNFGLSVVKAQRLMDDMVDIEIEQIDKIINKINLDPEPEDVKSVELNLWKKIRQACLNGRRTGLGITALGDTLAALNIRYGSEESVRVTEEIYKALAVNAYMSSIQLAEERGCFPVWDYELEKDHPFVSKIIKELPGQYQEKYKKYGRRNIALTTTAPTGSVSMMTQTTSGIEPAFAVKYSRRKKINASDNSNDFDYVDLLGIKWKTFDVYHHAFKEWMDVTGKTFDNFNESPYYNATANDVDWISSVYIQAAAQKWICHSISKTCNLPNSATKELVAEVYMKAWESGCKGFTVYRDGCRDGVLVTEKKPEADNSTDLLSWDRPEKLPCDIHHVNISGESWIIFVGKSLEGEVCELFGGLSSKVVLPKKIKNGFIIKTKKKKGDVSVYNLTYGEGEDTATIKDIGEIFENPTQGDFTRAFSLMLRARIPIHMIVNQMQKNEHSDMYSFSRVVARVLKKYIKEGTTIKQKCSNCGSESLVYIEGCLTCSSCGSSRCS